MPSPKQVISAVSQALGVPEGTVTVIDRLLMDAGLRQRALRGRGEAEISIEDAAKVIVAAATIRNTKDAPSMAIRFADVVAKVARELHLRSRNDGHVSPDFDIVLPSTGDLVETRRFGHATISTVAELYRNTNPSGHQPRKAAATT